MNTHAHTRTHTYTHTSWQVGKEHDRHQHLYPHIHNATYCWHTAHTVAHCNTPDPDNVAKSTTHKNACTHTHTQCIHGDILHPTATHCNTTGPDRVAQELNRSKHVEPHTYTLQRIVIYCNALHCTATQQVQGARQIKMRWPTHRHTHSNPCQYTDTATCCNITGPDRVAKNTTDKRAFMLDDIILSIQHVDVSQSESNTYTCMHVCTSCKYIHTHAHTRTHIRVWGRKSVWNAWPHS